MSKTKIGSTDHIFIYAPSNGSYQHIYNFLLSADFRKAHDRNTKGLFNIGLETVLCVLQQNLQGEHKPDLIYLETSLFPERTRINDKIVDFLCMQINDNLSKEERDDLLLNVFRQYKLIYNALHETENTVYFVPSFMQRPKQMQMVFSEYVRGTNPAQDVVDEINKNLPEIQTEITEIAARIEDEIKERDQAELKGWIEWKHEPVPAQALAGQGESEETPVERPLIENAYMTRDFLQRKVVIRETEDEDEEERRREEEADLQINAYLFHKLFHEGAFGKYAKSFLLCIPIVGAGEKPSKRRRRRSKEQQKIMSLVGQGALFVMLVYKNDSVSFEPQNNEGVSLEARNLATEIAKTVSYVLKDYFISYLYTSSREMVDEVINRSLRAAAGAIMSRNISHNIGSHVAPRTRMTAIEERLESFMVTPQN